MSTVPHTIWSPSVCSPFMHHEQLVRCTQATLWTEVTARQLCMHAVGASCPAGDAPVEPHSLMKNAFAAHTAILQATNPTTKQPPTHSTHCSYKGCSDIKSMSIHPQHDTVFLCLRWKGLTCGPASVALGSNRVQPMCPGDHQHSSAWGSSCRTASRCTGVCCCCSTTCS